MELAGVNVDDGTHATTAWSLAQAWVTDINARATVKDDQTAADIARVANRMSGSVTRGSPTGEQDRDLQSASRTQQPGWQQAWRIPAHTPTGQAEVHRGPQRPQPTLADPQHFEVNGGRAPARSCRESGVHRCLGEAGRDLGFRSRYLDGVGGR